MRRLSGALALVLLAGLLLVPAGCKKKRQRAAVKSDDGMLASMVHVADPRASVQLTKGFYGIESGAWRWTAGRFAVSLRPPRNSAQNGARLVLKFVIPGVVLERLHSMTLAAKVGGLALPPQEYTQPGDQTYSQDVPAGALTGNAVNVDFTLDKTLPPSASDQRELGIIANSVGFEAK